LRGSKSQAGREMRADFGSPPRLRPQTRQDAADDLIDATPSIRPLRYDLWKLFKLFLVVVSSPLAECSQWGEDPRWQQCRLTVAGAPYLFGPPTASGNPVTGNPQQCAYLFPGRNNYNKENEEVIGSFVAPDCGACAAACAASYLSANYESTPGPYRLMNEVVDQMSFQALRDFGDMLITSVDQCMPCTDWNYCSPEVAVVTQSTSLFEWEDSWNGFATFVPDDPYFQGRSDNCDSCNNCVGRFVENFRGNGGGEIRPYGYVGFGPDLCLVKSTTGCNNPGRTNQVPAGTCTLKYNPATEVAAHFPPEQADDDPHSTPAYIGNTNEDLWDYVDGEWSKRNTMWDGSLDGCPNEEVPYPTVNASDLAPCPGIDPEAGVFMSGMCDWTPSSK